LKDSVCISTALVSLAFKIIPNSALSEPLNEIFAFLSKTLLSARQEAFPAASPVGSALMDLLEFLQVKAADLSMFLELAGKPGYLALCERLEASALRKCQLSLAAWIRKGHLSEPAFYALFGCFLQCDVMKMLDTGNSHSHSHSQVALSEQFTRIEQDLTGFVDFILSLGLDEGDGVLLERNLQSGHLVCLFLHPRLVAAFPGNFALHRKLLKTLLSCTATALPPALFHEAEPRFEWLQPEFPKTLAMQLNLDCAQRCTDPSESFEFYCEVMRRCGFAATYAFLFVFLDFNHFKWTNFK
jgi:hypothetical protein